MVPATAILMGTDPEAHAASTFHDIMYILCTSTLEDQRLAKNTANTSYHGTVSFPTVILQS